VGVANCNRAYEGDIREKGAVVKICGVGDVSVGDYTKNTDMSAPQTLDDTLCELAIDQAKYFNFQIDDIDRAQSVPGIMNAAMKDAASADTRLEALPIYLLGGAFARRKSRFSYLA
jgi:hypothetical protein